MTTSILPVSTLRSYDIHAVTHARGDFFQVWFEGEICFQADTLRECEAWVRKQYTVAKVEVVENAYFGERFDVVITYVNGESFPYRTQARIEAAEHHLANVKDLYRLA